MGKPTVSVIIPTYKSRGGLQIAVDSAINQSYHNLEIIVVDDNNPDTSERNSTEDVMLEYTNNPRVLYLKHECNKNGAAARNTGIKAASGDYIAFLDDDDEWYPDKVEKQLEYLKNHLDCQCVYCLANVNGRKEFSTPYEGNAIIPILMNRTKMFTPSLMFTKSSLVSIGGFNESYRRHQDYELLVKFFAKGYKICCLKEILIDIHGLGGNQISSDEFILLKKSFLDLFKSQIDVLNLKHKGIRRKIIVANYVVVFDTTLARHQYKLAWKLFVTYFPQSPSAFISQCWFLIKGHISRKISFRNK